MPRLKNQSKIPTIPQIFNLFPEKMKDQFLNGHINPTLPDQQHLKCPRCDSPNTKFCYYNNYNLCQPRHYCRNCKRYWTEGGILRNIPIGGGSRKSTKRSSTTRKDSSSSSSTSARTAGIASSSMGTIETDSSSSLKVCFDQESKMLNLNGGDVGALLGSCNEESEEVRNVDQDNSNSTTSFRNRGNWLDLAM